MTANKGLTYRERVRPVDAGQRVLAHHVRRHAHLDEAAWRACIEAGLIRVAGDVATCDRVLVAGEEIEVMRPPWIEPDAPGSFGVLFEDDDVLVADKPSGLQVMPAGDFVDRTLVALVRASAADRREAAPIHRHGRGTSGAILFGKSARARSELSRQLRDGQLGKLYLAVVAASAESVRESFVVTQPIGRVATPHGAVHAASAEGRPARTRVRRLRSLGAARTLVAAWPITGRPHQIRIHLAFMGAAIEGDPLFAPGGDLLDARPGDCGYLLHSASVRFLHPGTGQRVRVRSHAPWLDAT